MSTTSTHSSNSHALYYALAALLAGLLWYIANHNHPIINNDGIEYIASARAMIEGDWLRALEKYKWPLYSMLIAGVHLIGVEIETAARLVNLVCQVFTALGIVRVCIALGAPRLVIGLALVFVIAAPALTQYRWMLIRDFGFLAGMLWGVAWVLDKDQFVGVRRWLWPLLAFAIAFGFRIEALWLIVTLPLFLRIDINTRLSHFALIVIAITALGSLASGVWLSESALATVFADGDWRGALSTGWVELFKQMELTKFRLEKYVLSHDLKHLSGLLYVVAVLVITLFFFVKLAQFGFVLLVWWDRAANGSPFTDPVRRTIVWGYFVLFVTMLVIYTFLRFYITERYALAAWSMFALAVPFAIRSLLARFDSGGVVAKSVVVSLLIIGLGSVGYSINKTSNRHHFREAGHWIKANLPADAEVFTGSRIVIYYAERNRAQTRIYEPYESFLFASAKAVWVPFDYVAAEIYGTPDADIMNQFNEYYQSTPIKVFTNGHSNTIAIYDVRDVR